MTAVVVVIRVTALQEIIEFIYLDTLTQTASTSSVVHSGATPACSVFYLTILFLVYIFSLKV